MAGKNKGAKIDKPGKQSEKRANWGANENPRKCRNQQCGAQISKIVTTKYFDYPRRCVRYRMCLVCGQRFSTMDLMP